jgi:hypothetical protein
VEQRNGAFKKRVVHDLAVGIRGVAELHGLIARCHPAFNVFKGKSKEGKKKISPF